MYISNDIAERIKLTAKNKGISVKKLLSDVGLGFNTMSNMKTSMPKSENLAKIADYLSCSVDYLLGRTDRSELLTTDEAQLLEAYNSSPYVKNAIDGLLGIGNVKQIPINRDNTLKTYAVALGGQTKQGEITKETAAEVKRLARELKELEEEK